MIYPTSPVRSFGQDVFSPLSARIITAERLKRVIEAGIVKTEETEQGIAVFFRCFVYFMDSRLETITAIMTPQAYRKWRNAQSLIRLIPRILPLPAGSVFQAVF